MRAVAPPWDENFADSRVHGEGAQRELLREVVRMCKQRRTAVDVGAHIGLWTRNLAPHFERVVAFEPDAENMQCLQLNTAMLHNVERFDMALGESAQQCGLTLPPDTNSGCWHVVPDGTFIEMCPLDDLELSDVDLLKLDVEGYEGAVLVGALQTIRRSKPVIVFEYNALGPKFFGEDWTDPKAVLASLGYTRRLHWRKDEVWIPAAHW